MIRLQVWWKNGVLWTWRMWCMVLVWNASVANSFAFSVMVVECSKCFHRLNNCGNCLLENMLAFHIVQPVLKFEACFCWIYVHWENRYDHGILIWKPTMKVHIKVNMCFYHRKKDVTGKNQAWVKCSFVLTGKRKKIALKKK